jgi:hypothetical protein
MIADFITTKSAARRAGTTVNYRTVQVGQSVVLTTGVAIVTAVECGPNSVNGRRSVWVTCGGTAPFLLWSAGRSTRAEDLALAG